MRKEDEGMTNYLTRLTQLIPPPGKRKKFDWAAVEKRLGVLLPVEFKETVEMYHGGQFEEYLYLLEPDNPYYDLVEITEERVEAYESLWESEKKPCELEEVGSSIIPWATTDNGEYLFWSIRSGQEQNPDKWTVMINEARGDYWEHFQMGCIQFLVLALEKQVSSDILWSQFPMQNHTFHRFILP